MKISEITAGQRKPIRLNLHEPEQFDRFWDQIERSCSDILETYRTAEKVFFRGTNGMPAIYRAASRESRPVRDSNAFISSLFDHCLVKLGFKAIRSNSIFMTSNPIHASEFGEVYIVFPINGFNYTYFNKEDTVLDNLEDVVDRDVSLEIQYNFQQRKHAAHLPYRKWSSFVMDSQCRTVEAVVKTLKEAMPDSEFIQQLKPDDLVSCKAVEHNFDPTSVNIVKALDETFETMVHGSYYAMSKYAFSQGISDKLGFKITHLS